MLQTEVENIAANTKLCGKIASALGAWQTIATGP